VIVRGCHLDKPRRILIRATNWLGDAVMSLPALEAVRRRFPEAEIVVLSKPWVSELYWRHPAVTRHIVYDPDADHRGVRGFWKLVRQLRDEHFDAVILFQNAFHAAWMAWLARIPVRVGYDRDGRGALLTDAVYPPRPAAYGHQVYYYLELLFRAGLIEKPEPLKEIRLALDRSEETWATKYIDALGLRGPRFLVGLNPGASFGPAKRWLPERFADLADRLINALHADVLIFGSHEERALAETVASEMEHTPIILAGETTLRQFMALLARCRLIITNDSGPMHLVGALGVPQVAVFGSTDERATGPVSPYARVVSRHVPCSPCGLRECPIDFRCMTGVSVADVYRVALELVKQVSQRSSG
jgi:heptosyltransferase-2